MEKIWLSDIRGQDRLVSGTGELKQLYELLVWSRFANKVYINLSEEKITDFDGLFDLMSQIEWSKYLDLSHRIVLDASSTRSTLSSTPTIQSISEKALEESVGKLNPISDIETHILILIIDDIAHILLDVTGDPLHKRGYRSEAWEAPIKENLAAALVAFSGWRYKEPLLDPFCGSGTIPIEAAMMARNIPPGLSRSFRIESLPFYDISLLREVKLEAKGKIYPTGNYKIYASDKDHKLVKIAYENARRAGVEKDIEFSSEDFVGGSISEWITIVTNPPYGKRIWWENLAEIYKELYNKIISNGGWFITSFSLETTLGLSNKKLLNGADECRFWYKKPERK
jgi:putative N6-adenine-specific DNA methylase